MKRVQIKSSIGMFDLLKGVAMIMLVFVHTFELFQVSFWDNNETNVLLRGFVIAFYMIFIGYLMPSLLVVSGYGARKVSSNKKNIIRQARTLLIPYLITTIATSLLHLTTHFILYRYLPGSIKETGRIAGGFFLGLSETTEYFGIKLFSCGPNWFLLMLFWGLIIFNFISNHFAGIKLLFTAAIIACIGWLTSFLPFEIPWCIPQGLIACYFICLGYLVKKKKLYTDGISCRSILICICFVIVPNLIPGIRGLHYGMANNVYPLGPITIIENGLFAVFVVGLFLLINSINIRLFSSIRLLGRYSIYFLCVHTAEMMGFPLYYFVGNWNGSKLAGAIVFSLCRLVVDITICYFIIKIKKVIDSFRQKRVRKND